MRTDDTPDRQLESSRFGRKNAHAATAVAAPATVAGDIKLFAITFAGGFLFMTIFLA